VLVIAHVSPATLADPAMSQTLTTVATEHELVLICTDDHVTGGLLPYLRATLPRHQVVALLTNGDLSRRDRELTADLLNDGVIPLIITDATDESAQLLNWHWLGAHTVVTAPAPARSQPIPKS
jgi:hypothetical protein